MPSAQGDDHMIRTLQEIVDKAREGKTLKMAVACAQDEAVLEAVCAAQEAGIAEPILIGDKEGILSAAKKVSAGIDENTIIDVPDKMQACRTAAMLVREGKAALIMKGLVDTAYIMKAVLDKEAGLRTERTLSHATVLEVPGFDRLFMVTDSALNIAPDLEQKIHILNNAVLLAHALDNPAPRVALLCAVEKVNPKMQCTLDAQEIVNRYRAGELKNCFVEGPLALDNAVSKEAALHKGIGGEVAGCADILLVPDIEAGNMLNKSMEYFAHAKKAGVISGAKTPVVLVSRASSAESKLYSIALGAVLAEKCLEDS